MGLTPREVDRASTRDKLVLGHPELPHPSIVHAVISSYVV